MMKILLMCEGANEEKLLELLLDESKLKFTRDDLIGLKPFNVRQLKNPFIKTQLKNYNKPVQVFRIGDKQNEKFPIPNDLRHIVNKNEIYKYCTKPELEILLIINENKLNEFNKSKKKAKTFAKENIIYNKKYYDQSTEFLENYYGGNRIDMLIENLKEYKKIKKHKKDELFLADLLKESK